jgi:hypothetical protein
LYEYILDNRIGSVRGANLSSIYPILLVGGGGYSFLKNEILPFYDRCIFPNECVTISEKVKSGKKETENEHEK